MSQKVIYEKNFKLREELTSWFKENAQQSSECYSLSKLKLLKQKNEDLIVFVRPSEVDLEEIKSQVANVKILDDLDPLNGLKILLSSSSDIQEVKALTGKYQFDILCIGSSTGGLPVVQKIIKGINQKATIVIICQHISKEHSSNIVDSLSKQIKQRFKTIEKSTELVKGYTYFLSGGSDFEIRSKYNKLYLEPVGMTSESYHPSFNVLTGSLRSLNGPKCGCIILSGLGDDGSKHLKDLKEKKVKILVQDPNSAIAPFMPKAAISTGQVDHIYNENQLHDFIKRSAA